MLLRPIGPLLGHIRPRVPVLGPWVGRMEAHAAESVLSVADRGPRLGRTATDGQLGPPGDYEQL